MPPSLSATSAITASTRSRTSHRLRALAADPVSATADPSASTLRFRLHPPTPPLNPAPTPPSAATLTRLILAPVPVSPSPDPYLARYPPARNALHSLLALLARQHAPPAARALLLRVAVHAAPPPPGRAVAPREAVALDFVRAVVATPPRVPVELRTALRATHAPDRLLHVALTASFAAYYATVAALLGLRDAVPACTRAARTMRLSINGEGEFASAAPSDGMVRREPSRASAPAAPPHHSSRPRRLPSRTRFVHRVAMPLRLKVALRSLQHAQRAAWLAPIPPSKRSQDDFIRAAMGFTPEYLHNLRAPADRAVFIYIIDEILLRDGPQHLSTAVKNLVCYILARSAENSVLTAHSAFLANRFGARDDQLAACMDHNLLHALQRSYAIRNPPTESSVSSAESPPSPSKVKKRGRHGASSPFSFMRHNPFEDRPDPVSKSPRDAIARNASTPSYRQPTGRFAADRLELDIDEEGVDGDDEEDGDDDDDIDHHGHLYDEDQIEEEHPIAENDTGPKIAVRSMRTTRNRSFLSRLRQEKPSATTSRPSFDREEEAAAAAAVDLGMDDDDSASESEDSESSDGSDSDDEHGQIAEGSLYDSGDEPEVPEVNGLNAIDIDDYDPYQSEHDDYPEFVEDVEEDDYDPYEEPDRSLFTQQEVAFLLLAHDVAQASRRNSRLCAKYAEAAPGPLVSVAHAAVIHELFEPETIMEVISVIASFHLLQRWTVCYPYRPGALEAPVRRFVQSPIAHDLCVGSVGQRSSSKSSAQLRAQQGRSLRLPRHSMVNNM